METSYYDMVRNPGNMTTPMSHLEASAQVHRIQGGLGGWQQRGPMEDDTWQCTGGLPGNERKKSGRTAEGEGDVEEAQLAYDEMMREEPSAMQGFHEFMRWQQRGPGKNNTWQGAGELPGDGGIKSRRTADGEEAGGEVQLAYEG